MYLGGTGHAGSNGGRMKGNGWVLAELWPFWWICLKSVPSDGEKKKKNVWQGGSLVDVRRGNWIGAMF
jgi:hypothetical protein